MGTALFGAALCLLVLAGPGALRAAEVPRPTAEDARVRRIVYSPDQVATVLVRRGTVTRVLLAADERIEVSATGLSARCDKDEDQWCIRAEAGTNQVFVRPKEGAVHTNMEMKTNRREYSLEFRVVRDDAPAAAKKRGGETEREFYRVVFEYPTPPAVLRAAVVNSVLPPIAQAESIRLAETPSARALLASARPKVRNSNYTMQVLDKGEDAAPSLVFDDGRFTYFEFRGARELPAIYAYGSDGEPVRTNWHFEEPFLVVERTARKFTLRLGDAVTGVFNESFDPVGLSTPNRASVPGVRRADKGVAE